MERQRRQHRRSEPEEVAGGTVGRFASSNRIKGPFQLAAKEDRDDRRRRLICAETVILTDVGDAGPQQLLVAVNSRDHGNAEKEELNVFGRGIAWLEQVLAAIGSHRPVVVLARAVDAGKGLLMHQADEAIAARDVLKHLHRELLMVGANV